MLKVDQIREFRGHFKNCRDFEVFQTFVGKHLAKERDFIEVSLGVTQLSVHKW